MSFLSKIKDALTNGVLQDLGQMAMVLVPFIAKAEEDLGSGNGEAKKNQVIGELMTILREPGGFEAKPWVFNALEKVVFPFLIDMLVKFLNSQAGKN